MLQQANNNQLHDTIIVGGGAAGLAAATVLARAHRKVTIVDAGKQSNLVAHEAHGVFTRDKTPPKELYAIATEQLLQYPTARIIRGTVATITIAPHGFTTQLASGKSYASKTIVLAQGMNYVLPEIDGLQALWGTKAWYCPYCEGYESQGKKLLAIMEGAWRKRLSHILPIWNNDITMFSPQQVNRVALEAETVKVYLHDGSVVEADQIVTQISQQPRDKLAQDLGCKTTETGHIQIDAEMRTTTPGVYAAGDQTMPGGQINFAVAAGHRAGMSINTYLA